MGNQKFHVTHLIVVLASLWWSGTEPTMSTKYACIILKLYICILYNLCEYNVSEHTDFEITTGHFVFIFFNFFFTNLVHFFLC